MLNDFRKLFIFTGILFALTLRLLVNILNFISFNENLRKFKIQVYQIVLFHSHRKHTRSQSYYCDSRLSLLSYSIQHWSFIRIVCMITGIQKNIWTSFHVKATKTKTILSVFGEETTKPSKCVPSFHNWRPIPCKYKYLGKIINTLLFINVEKNLNGPFRCSTLIL